MFNSQMKDVLIIEPSHGMWFSAKRRFGYAVAPPYVSENLFLRFLREIWFRCNLPKKEIWYNKSIKFEKYNTIIIYDSLITNDYLLWLREKCENQRLIFSYNNPIKDDGERIRFLKEIGIEAKTWEKKAADKYSISCVAPSYLGEFALERKKESLPRFDVIFFGRDKGRMEQILEMQAKLEKQKLNTYFHISASHRYTFGKRYKKLIPYEEILDFVKSTRAILDLTQKGQTGTTLRAREALFFGVKLITDNENVRELSFYNPNNIFILGQDDINELYNFVHSPYEPVPEEIINEYEFENVYAKYLLKPLEFKEV